MSISKRNTAGGAVYDVRLRTAAGRAYKRTFPTLRAARDFQAGERTAAARGQVVDPFAGHVSLTDYARQWLDDRVLLRPSTWQTYELLLRRHILPGLGDRPLAKIATADVRRWHANLLKARPTKKSIPPKSYRLLATIMATAVEDGVIAFNPCVLKRVGVEHPAERPTATIPQVYAIAGAIDPPLSVPGAARRVHRAALR